MKFKYLVIDNDGNPWGSNDEAAVDHALEGDADYAYDLELGGNYGEETPWPELPAAPAEEADSDAQDDAQD